MRLTSHVLDAGTGSHAAGIRVACDGLDAGGGRTRLFAVAADASGRIDETVENARDFAALELVFAAAAWRGDADNNPVGEVVVRLDPHRAGAHLHVPVILSAHGCSLWWSQ